MTRSPFFLFAAATLALACSSPVRPVASEPAPLDPLARQIEHGARVYRGNCGKCHGWKGHGTAKGPALVGDDALPLQPLEDSDRTRPFRTALDVAAYATATMPPLAGAREDLTADDYWAVLAFVLSANGFELESPIDADNGGSLVLHPSADA